DRSIRPVRITSSWPNVAIATNEKPSNTLRKLRTVRKASDCVARTTPPIRIASRRRVSCAFHRRCSGLEARLMRGVEDNDASSGTCRLPRVASCAKGQIEDRRGCGFALRQDADHPAFAEHRDTVRKPEQLLDLRRDEDDGRAA